MKLTFRSAKTPVVDFGQIPEGHMVYAFTEDQMLLVGCTDSEIPAEYRNNISKYDAKDYVTAAVAIKCERPEQARVLAVAFDQLWKRMRGKVGEGNTLPQSATCCATKGAEQNERKESKPV